MRRVSAALLSVILTGTPALAENRIGFADLHVPASTDGRSLEGAIWYPADPGGEETLIGDNPVLVGQRVLAGAVPAEGPHPLVVLSHGYGGNWTNQDWLAVDLVRHGYVVAAVNHPGTTTKDMSAEKGRQLWERPADVSRTIDALTRDGDWSRAIDPDRVAAIGHSLGGWTVMELAGARFDPVLFDAECSAHAGLAACDVIQKLGATRDAESRSALARLLADPRVKAVVSFDLGGSRGFGPASLAKVAVPVLVVAAGSSNPQIPAALESRHLAGLLPAGSTRYIELETAAHFSFLPTCKPGAEALLAKDSPDDVIVCRDGPDGNREALHQQVADQVTRFLDQTLRGPKPDRVERQVDRQPSVDTHSVSSP